MTQPDYATIFPDNPEMAAAAALHWQVAALDLHERGFDTPAMLDMADRYARLYAEYDVLYPVAVREGPVKAGPNGGDFVNLTWTAVGKLHDRIVLLEQKMKLDHGFGGKRDKPATTAADEYL